MHTVTLLFKRETCILKKTIMEVNNREVTNFCYREVKISFL